ncbi:MAG TPA: BON domain-containing protein [Vicinamibacterales bacterium]|nr:BON domain-containing protein [Vicinamibacterales bacterium]
MNTRGSLLAATAAGAGLTYLLDPARGARRRARLRDTMAHASTVTRRAISMTARDAVHRTYGTAASLRGALRQDRVDDVVLAERVRAKLGRYVSHPHALDVASHEGVVTIVGPILTVEAPRLLRAVRAVRGVHDVVDALERHDEPGSVPSLQGGRKPHGERLDAMQDHWSPTTRCMAWTAGAAFVTLGAARRDLPGLFSMLAGLTLIARAATNRPLKDLTGVTGCLEASRRTAHQRPEEVGVV